MSRRWARSTSRGPDAGEFLDFVYCNMFSTLKPGRVRYGLMLREDGHVMDDGTDRAAGRESLCHDDHHLPPPGRSWTHLEFVHQCLRPDLDVAFISTTEQWAQFSVAGPKARDLINSVLDQPIDNESFPFMACGEVLIHGVKGRLFRISFSGEHAYEIAGSRRAMARRCSGTSSPAPKPSGAVPTGWRRSMSCGWKRASSRTRKSTAA